MRYEGVLRSWNDERGFGFIAPRDGGKEIFFHVSALPKDGSRPTLGETLSYELGSGTDGRVQALRVIRTAVGARPQVRSQSKPVRASNGVFGLLLTATLVAVVGVFAYQRFDAWRNRVTLRDQPAVPVEQMPEDQMPEVRMPAAESPATTYQCDGRQHCSQMSSCAEATWFINHCPGTKMDGDGDGIPCEQEICGMGG